MSTEHLDTAAGKWGDPSYKCNAFVATVIDLSGAKVPNVASVGSLTVSVPNWGGLGVVDTYLSHRIVAARAIMAL